MSTTKRTKSFKNKFKIYFANKKLKQLYSNYNFENNIKNTCNKLYYEYNLNKNIDFFNALTALKINEDIAREIMFEIISNTIYYTVTKEPFNLEKIYCTFSFAFDIPYIFIQNYNLFIDDINKFYEKYRLTQITEGPFYEKI